MRHTENLKAAKEILSQFIGEIQKRCPLDDLRMRSYRLLYANPHLPSDFKNNRLLYDLSLPAIFNQPMIDDFANWQGKWKKANPDKRREIPHPIKEETLIKYLRRLLSSVEKINRPPSSLWRSLQSFILFLKEKSPEDSGIIDFLFPEQMKLFDNQIIRTIPPSAYPIDIVTAATIVENLIMKILNGRENAQLNSAYALGFAWTCLTSSRVQFPIHLKTLHVLQNQSINAKQNVMHLPTFCGEIPVPISKILASYLLTIAPQASMHLFTPPLSTLRRTFQRVVKNTSTIGKITFLTLMSPPHEVHGHRYQPK